MRKASERRVEGEQRAGKAFHRVPRNVLLFTTRSGRLPALPCSLLSFTCFPLAFPTSLSLACSLASQAEKGVPNGPSNRPGRHPALGQLLRSEARER
jgi:hypothetical protein